MPKLALYTVTRILVHSSTATAHSRPLLRHHLQHATAPHQTPTVELEAGTGFKTIDFHYHMYGSTIGQLHVQVSDESDCDDSSTWSTVWSKDGATGNTWLPASIDSLNSNSYTCLRFMAVSASYTGDIAIDNLYISVVNSPSLPPTVSAAPTAR